jgi:hypothetical protein
MWHKAQDQPSQGVSDRPCVGTFPKPIFTTCQSKLVRGVSNMGKAVQGENLAALPTYQVGPTYLIFSHSTALLFL